MPYPFISIPKDLLQSNVQGYTDDQHERKVKFHKAAKKFLKGVADALAFSKDSYDIRTNMAGPAVSGETTLHADTVYLQVYEAYAGGARILFRSCDGRKDYSGGQNRLVGINDLLDERAQERFIKELAQIHASQVAKRQQDPSQTSRNSHVRPRV